MPTALYILARNMRMRAEEIRMLAEDMNADEPKAIMLRIAADYERLVKWAENSSGPEDHLELSLTRQEKNADA